MDDETERAILIATLILHEVSTVRHNGNHQVRLRFRYQYWRTSTTFLVGWAALGRVASSAYHETNDWGYYTQVQLKAFLENVVLQ